MKAVNLLLVISILLFATVMSWTYFSVRGDQISSLPQTGIGGGPDAVDFKTQFSTLLPEHGNLAVIHLTNLYDGRDTANTSRSLEDNAQKLGDVFKQLGTAADREVFLRSFRAHIDEYEVYIKGRKENKPAAINTAKENLQMHAMDFGNLTNKLMPTLSKQRATELMNEHTTMTLAIIDAHAKGDITRKTSNREDADAQAMQFANELATGAEAVGK